MAAGRNLFLQDNPGYNDTRHRFTDADLIDNISKRLAYTGLSNMRFIVTESLGGDAN